MNKGVFQMTIVKEKINILPVKIIQLLQGHQAIQVLKTAVELNIFDQLASGAQDAQSISSAVKADERSLVMLLDALVSIGVINKQNSSYSLTEDSRIYLVSSSSLYMCRYMQLYEDRQNVWRQLSSIVRTGKPADEVNKAERAEEFFPALAETIFPMNFALAHRVADELKISQLPAKSRILDVAAGAGTWSIPMALANKNLLIDALDFPSTLEVTKKFATNYGVVDQYSYISGNWRDVKWHKNTYDAVLLGHILHSEGEDLSKQLIEQCFTALKPGGILVIAEMIANDDRGGPAQAMLFGINMLLNTSIGCVFSDAELNQMLTQAGFVKTSRMAVPEIPASPIMISYKPN